MGLSRNSEGKQNKYNYIWKIDLCSTKSRFECINIHTYFTNVKVNKMTIIFLFF